MIQKWSCQKTQTYWAGHITALLYNSYSKRNDLPDVTVIMMNCRNLKTILGKYYTLLKSNSKTNYAIEKYESFDIMNIPNDLKGGYEEFMIGYSYKIKKIPL